MTTVFWIPGPESWRGRLGITSRPRGGDRLADEVRAWRNAGIDVVVSLLELAEEAELALGGERTLAEANGLEFRPFPIADMGVPASQNAVGELVEHLDDVLHDGKSVAVHCRQGIGRSSLITAATLMAGGMEPERALDAVRRARGVPVPETEPQRRWIAECGDWLAGKRLAQPRRASNER